MRMMGRPQNVFSQNEPIIVYQDRFLDGTLNDDRIVLEQGNRYMITDPIEAIYLKRMGYDIRTRGRVPCRYDLSKL